MKSRMIPDFERRLPRKKKPAKRNLGILPGTATDTTPVSSEIRKKLSKNFFKKFAKSS